MNGMETIREAYESGYSRGHNDTVESCYVDPSIAADDYIAALDSLEQKPSEDARKFADKIMDMGTLDEYSNWTQIDEAAALIAARDASTEKRVREEIEGSKKHG